MALKSEPIFARRSAFCASAGGGIVKLFLSRSSCLRVSVSTSTSLNFAASFANLATFVDSTSLKYALTAAVSKLMFVA